MKSHIADIPIDAITVEDRLREVDPVRAEALAAMIAEMGLQHPITVVDEDGRYRLSAGAHRLEAFRLLDRDFIPATVYDARWMKPGEARMIEIIENVGRSDLTALERARYLTELKAVYDELHPEQRHGGDRKSQAAQNKDKNRVAILAIRFEIADQVGLSDRAVRDAIQIYTGLSPKTRKRVTGTWIANHRATLKDLSKLEPVIQTQVLDLLLAAEPIVKSVGDALIILAGKKPPSAADKLFKNTQSGLAKMPKKARAGIFEAYRSEIIMYGKKAGWFDL